MTEDLPRPSEYSSAVTIGDAETFGRVEAGQIADLMIKFGTIAVMSEVGASLVTGSRTPIIEQALPNPVSTDNLKPRKFYIDDAWKKTEKKPDEKMVGFDREIRSEQEKLSTLLSVGQDTDVRSIRQYLSGLTQRAKLRDNTAVHNEHKALENLVVPLYLRSVAENNLYGADRDTGEDRSGQDDRVWESYFSRAGDTQIVNFAQWYTSELRKVATPHEKAIETARIHTRYGKGLEDTFVTGGWMSPATKDSMTKRVNKGKLYFRSPFTFDASQDAGGVSYRTNYNGRIAVINIGGKPATTDHELTHLATDVSRLSLFKEVKARANVLKVGENETTATMRYVEYMFSEAFAEHTANALNYGNPDMMSPLMRRRNNIETGSAGAEDKLYGDFLDITSILLEGKNGAGHLEPETVSGFYTAMTRGKYSDVQALIASRWEGQDVLGESITELLKAASEDEGVINSLASFKIEPYISNTVRANNTFREVIRRHVDHGTANTDPRLALTS